MMTDVIYYYYLQFKIWHCTYWAVSCCVCDFERS